MTELKLFNEKMEKLANQVADQLLADTAPSEDVVDAFKALSGYYSSSRKLGKVQDGDTDRPNGGLGAAKRRIENAAEGSHTGDGLPIPN